MTQFGQSEWQDPDKARAYRERADILIQDRPRLFSLLVHFFQHFYSDNAGIRVLDLGCGDGILGEHLKSCDIQIHLSAWDGSEDMLAAARKRLERWQDVDYLQITFQELLKERRFGAAFDFVVSSFAIHHASHEEKRGLFAQIHHFLKKDGFFINIDTAIADASLYDAFYNEIWRRWLVIESNRHQLDDDLSDVPEKAKQKPENQYESLSVQLRLLEMVGFQDVECFYKSGLFTMYGGRK